MILLVDMDAFFASVEQSHHPHLRGVPVIVCGDPSRRGVVTAASYEARPSGVHAGMPLAEARRLCPGARYVEGNPEKYVAISIALLDLFTTWTPDVEPFSVDEAFLGFGSNDRRAGTLAGATALAREVQAAVAGRFDLPCSVGVGPNKLVAKMAAGLGKPRGITPLDEARFRAAFWPRDVQELWGVGPQLGARMQALGIATVGDLARAPAAVLKAAFGVIGPQLAQAAQGHDDTPLVPYHRGVDPKSMGHEVTLPADCRDPFALEGTLRRLSDQVARRLRTEGFVARVVAVKLRDANFVTTLRQRALPESTAHSADIFAVAHALLRDHWRGGPLRLLGVTASQLAPAAAAEQVELFGRDDRSRRLERAADRLRDRLGEAALFPAGAIGHRRQLGHVPFGTPQTPRPGGVRPARPHAPVP